MKTLTSWRNYLHLILLSVLLKLTDMWYTYKYNEPIRSWPRKPSDIINFDIFFHCKGLPNRQTYKPLPSWFPLNVSLLPTSEISVHLFLILFLFGSVVITPSVVTSPARAHDTLSFPEIGYRYAAFPITTELIETGILLRMYGTNSHFRWLFTSYCAR